MQRTSDNMAWATKAILKLANLPGGPRIDEHVEAFAEQLCDIVHSIQPEPELKFDEETRERKPTGNSVIPGDWLVDQALKSYRRFPAPIDLRFMYMTRFIPGDGIRPLDLAAREG